MASYRYVVPTEIEVDVSDSGGDYIVRINNEGLGSISYEKLDIVSDVSDLNDKVDGLESDLGTADNAITLLTEKVEAMETALNSANSTINELNTSLNAVKDTNASLSNTVNDQAVRLAEAESAITLLQGQEDALRITINNNYESNLARINHIKTQITDLQNHLASLTDNFNENASEIHLIKLSLEALETALNGYNNHSFATTDRVDRHLLDVGYGLGAWRAPE